MSEAVNEQLEKKNDKCFLDVKKLMIAGFVCTTNYKQQFFWSAQTQFWQINSLIKLLWIISLNIFSLQKIAFF